MRVPFSEVFKVNPGGAVSPRLRVRFGGFTLTPGVAATAGISFGGVNLTKLIDRDLEVEQETDGLPELGHRRLESILRSEIPAQLPAVCPVAAMAQKASQRAGREVARQKTGQEKHRMAVAGRQPAQPTA